MSAYAYYLICGPMETAQDARDLASAWDACAGTMYRNASLYVIGADPTVGTHTCSYGRILTAAEPAIRAGGAELMASGWQMIQNDDPDAALALAGLGRVVRQMP